MKFEYTANGKGRFSFYPEYAGFDLDVVANEAAKDYYYNHEGREATWPISFKLFLDDVRLGWRVVELDIELIFKCQE